LDNFTQTFLVLVHALLSLLFFNILPFFEDFCIPF
jgi:hypothetical protein